MLVCVCITSEHLLYIESALSSYMQVVDTGIDWGQAFKWRGHSLGALLGRIGSLKPEYRSKKWAATPIVIIRGPKEPKRLAPYIIGMLKRFKRRAGEYCVWLMPT